MHRTTTTATLLVTVAVLALSGCVTVHRAPVPGPSAGGTSARASVPRPDGTPQPRAVQAPAREALEMAGDPRRPEHHGTAASRPPSPGIESRPATAPAPRTGTGTGTKRHPRHDSRPPLPVRVPGVAGQPDVCALGRAYGGWRADSPQARICHRAYGN
ncbi:hypothetical protein [Streptomyces sp. NPDC086787]|uniref:hypothetical protein n=1 Tax=Streptomyces sp. NPDC086787 TaxID=3365759 RepID=UPI0038281C5B